MRKIFSDLDLNGPTPPRVQPRIGQWGSGSITTTRQKRRLRIIVPIVFILSALAVAVLMYLLWSGMTGLRGFGLDPQPMPAHPSTASPR